MYVYCMEHEHDVCVEKYFRQWSAHRICCDCYDIALDALYWTYGSTCLPHLTSIQDARDLSLRQDTME